MSEHVARFKTTEQARGEDVLTWCDGSSLDHDEAGALIVTNQRAVFYRWSKRGMTIKHAIPRARITGADRRAGRHGRHIIAIHDGKGASGNIEFETDDALSVEAVLRALDIPDTAGDATMVARVRPGAAAPPVHPPELLDEDGTVIARPAAPRDDDDAGAPAAEARPTFGRAAAARAAVEDEDVFEPAPIAERPLARRASGGGSSDSGLSPMFLVGVALLAVAVFIGLLLF
ncbi:hypothetical protein [Zavarzinia sp. CC-PAN008]|uniref:hypothetical protein n=1 Tax=Zavarzinia sp. CC-PAN008 TaxID=3243332 RepID=UPI003F747474